MEESPIFSESSKRQSILNSMRSIPGVIVLTEDQKLRLQNAATMLELQCSHQEQLDTNLSEEAIFASLRVNLVEPHD
jgi:hypothetical protein